MRAKRPDRSGHPTGEAAEAAEAAEASDAGAEPWRQAAYERVEGVLAIPMLALSVALLPVLLVPMADPGLSVPARDAFTTADWTIWCAFAIEYVVKFGLAPRRWTFVRTHKFDLVLVLLPMARPLRILRSARLLRLAAFGRAGAAVGKAAGEARHTLLVRSALYAPLAVGAFAVAAGVVVFDAERRAAHANIRTLGDALWWAITTVTTVGYGDRYPVTATGRIVAAGLMVVGISALGVVTAAIASWLVRLVEEPHDRDESATLGRVLEELQALRAEVAELRGAQPRSRPPGAAISVPGHEGEP